MREGSPDSSGVEVSELADEGEQGPTSYSCHRMKCDRRAEAAEAWNKFEEVTHQMEQPSNIDALNTFS